MKQLITTTLILIGASFAYDVVFLFFYIWMRYGAPLEFPFQTAAWSLAINFIPIFYLVVVNYLLIYRFPLKVEYVVKLILDVVISMASLVLLNLLFVLLTGESVEYAGTVFSNVLIIVGLESLYYEKALRRAMEQQALSRQEILRYQYEALKAQVNPHFLFNSLNILYSFIPVDTERSREYVLHLSRIYRYILNQADRTEVTLGEELSFLKSYTDILAIRFNDNFRVEISGTEPYLDRTIIPYTLQMLVENVTKHNAISSQTPMTVTITADEEGLTVSNPVNPKPTDLSTHLGTKYLSKLYESHSRSFTITGDSGHFTAKVPYL